MVETIGFCQCNCHDRNLCLFQLVCFGPPRQPGPSDIPSCRVRCTRLSRAPFVTWRVSNRLYCQTIMSKLRIWPPESEDGLWMVWESATPTVQRISGNWASWIKPAHSKYHTKAHMGLRNILWGRQGSTSTRKVEWTMGLVLYLR